MRSTFYTAFLAALLSISPSLQQSCPSANSAAVGATAKFTTNADKAAGNFKMTGPCEFTITGLTLAPGVPMVYIWAATNASDVGGTGVRIADTHLSPLGYNDASLTFSLFPNVTLSKYTRIVMWCEEFKANLADFDLSAAIKAAGSSSGAASCPGVASNAVAVPLKFTTNADGAAGNLYINSDCKTFTIKDLTLNTGVPKVYVWGGADLKSMKRISDSQLSTTGYDKATLDFNLLSGISWADIKVVSLYCENFAADLADLTIADAAAAAPSTSTSTDFQFDNCLTLLPGSYNLHWTINATHIAYGFETAAKGSGWAAFGFADQTLKRSGMVGSNVVVAGYHPGLKFFTRDYYLNSTDQCDDKTGNGVCPITDASSFAGTAVVSSQDGNPGRYIKVVRKLKPDSGSANPQRLRAIPTGTQAYAVWAFGPLSEDPNKPVVLYHGPNQHVKGDLLIDLAGNKTNACNPIVGATNVTISNGNVSTVADVTAFEITTGTNFNYPNPPGWGLSYRINGLETPVIKVYRGTKYTFTVKASAQHPLYITSSMLGGKSNIESAGGVVNETVYAGGPAGKGVAGTTDAPGVLEWTPDKSTPDMVYYQCYTHQKLGWRILVQDAKPSGAMRLGPWVGGVGAAVATAFALLA
ncbi:hypothetical protein HDU97_000499 [Phlyctochytrium planicorne]|nr:hypothetical protein HDU97_000499 [Phlyctochytrium planicorne]